MVEEGFIEIPESSETPEGDSTGPSRRFLAPAIAALAVILFLGGAYAFGKYAHSGSSSFLANISSLFEETFSGGGELVETIPLGGEREVSSSGGGGAAPVAESMGDGSAAAQPSSQGVSAPICASAGNPSRAVLLNEVAWAGTASDATTHEWIELMTPGSAAVPLAGWQLTNKSGGIRVVFGSRAVIEGKGYLLLERKDDSAVPGVAADAFFTNAIKNSDEELQLYDATCGLVDKVEADVGSGKRWPAGEAAPGYRSAERGSDLSWHTYQGNARNGIFGTPKAENSPPPSPAVQLARPPTSTVPVSAPSSTEAPIPPPAPTSPSGTGRIIISEVMAGMDGAIDYEFVELYNADDHAVDLTGWTVKKRTSTGSESTLVAASRLEGKTIPLGGYLLLAREGGYAGTVRADVLWPKSSSYALAYTKNAVMFYDAGGAKVDEAAWSEIPEGSSYARVPVSASLFSIQAVPTPQNAVQ
ncbi:MAG: lamin tail domain-containing protein [Candidatus Jorgensenbacteria bacterium]